MVGAGLTQLLSQGSLMNRLLLPFTYLLSSMGRISKTFTLLLTLTIMTSCLTFMTVKLVDAQSTPVPEIKILYPANGTFFNISMGVVSFQLKYATNNTLSWLGYSVDGGQNRTAYGEWYDLEQRLYDMEGNPSVWVYGVFENDGNHNLTLYANNTAGDWATPQTVTYLVNINADTAFPPTTSNPLQSPSLSPTSTPTLSPRNTPYLDPIYYLIPLSMIVAVIILSLLLYRKHRKNTNLQQ